MFNGDRSKFEDWKMRIMDKISLNKDHYPTHAFQINYVVSRLGGKTVEHTVPRRRKTTKNPYLSVDDLLDQLSDLYETPADVIRQRNVYDYSTFRRRDSQSFSEYYTEFMKHAAYMQEYGDKEYQINVIQPDLIIDLRNRANLRLLDEYAMYGRKWTLPDLKEHLIMLEYRDLMYAERLADKKAKVFAKQYAKARLEDASKPRGKYAIIPRPDPEEYRR
ncbi:hypothetical protein HO173_003331 [Letharia columbiana]|uniref:Uncharacterized protein n=1 Tax=Letharia columbiana TaxID=112416 RepID=A0A8H6G1K8_9LECA|nr:uncharacterized protein HO173_003331 [Letharia columbiana]KAF6238824.1 hypothetical protein HO173_003331 [Letharia columbiana]